MKKKNTPLVCALDVDGVLMQNYPPINQRCINKFHLEPTFDIQKKTRSWNMTELPPEIAEYAISCFGDAKVASQYTFKKGAKKFVKEIYDMMQRNGGELIFNTHCFNDKVGEIRRQQLEGLCEELGIHPKFNISVGKHKVNCPADIIIDDYIGNLQKSDASLKILFAVFHNRNVVTNGEYKSRSYPDILNMMRAYIER